MHRLRRPPQTRLHLHRALTTAAPAAKRSALARKLVTRVVLLAITGVSLYILAPSLIQTFSSWKQLSTLQPAWIALGLAFECLSFLALWELQRIALQTPSWFAVGTSQLVGGAIGRIVPVGGAAANAAQYRMLVRAGVPAGRAASGLTASFAATSATMFALPVLALPAFIGGSRAPDGLLQAGYIGIAGFVLTAALGVAAFVSDRPLLLAGRAARWAGSHLGKREAWVDLPERVLAHRDAIRQALGKRWHLALASSVGNWGFQYLVLLACLGAVGARPNPALVLLAFVGSTVLALIPLTPGGLGFVEAGLTGLLALAGVGGQEAVVATLAYRLITFWLPLPAGGVAYVLYRRRYGSVESVVEAASEASGSATTIAPS